jgi:hypothetical protein
MNPMPTWPTMWLQCALLHAGDKTLSLRCVGAMGSQANGRRLGTYLLLSPGMNATTVVCVDLMVVYDAAAGKGALW